MRVRRTVIPTNTFPDKDSSRAEQEGSTGNANPVFGGDLLYALYRRWMGGMECYANTDLSVKLASRDTDVIIEVILYRWILQSE